MSPETVMTIGSRALEITLLLAAPLLLVALVTGLVVGAFQAATQINEQTLSFIPKLLAMALAMVVAGPWMLKVVMSYTRELCVRMSWCFMGGAAFGPLCVPGRIRIVLAGAIALIIGPLVPSPADIAPFSATGVVVTVQQIIIGIAIGFSLQLLFDAVTLGGQLLANSMGLSFAFNTDPMHGAETPVLGQIYSMLVMLTFLALDGHLTLIEVLVDGFRPRPVGTTGLGQDGV